MVVFIQIFNTNKLWLCLTMTDTSLLLNLSLSIRITARVDKEEKKRHYSVFILILSVSRGSKQEGNQPASQRASQRATWPPTCMHSLGFCHWGDFTRRQFPTSRNGGMSAFMRVRGRDRRRCKSAMSRRLRNHHAVTYLPDLPRGDSRMLD